MHVKRYLTYLMEFSKQGEEKRQREPKKKEEI